MLSRLFRTRFTLGLALLWLALAPHVAAQTADGLVSVPALTARVTDLTGTLSAEQRQSLEDKLAAFEVSQGSQIVVLLVATTQPEDIAAYANRVFNTWKPGRKGIGDGLLLVVAKQDRKIRIEVGRALEGAVPDLAAKRVIDETMTPAFRQGDFAGGLEQATGRLMALVRGEALPPPAAQVNRDEADWLNLGMLLFIALPLVGTVARRILGHKLGTLATGGLIGYITYTLTTSLLLAMGAGLLAMMFTFVAGTAWGAAVLDTSRQRRHGGPWGGYTSGGWGDGGGFGGGGGGGGFSSGGGGDGAGGGASGDW
jgi:uncharacterized protein